MAVCFKCQDDFPSYRALEVHLRSCNETFEPQTSAAWAFIPPPTSYGPTRRPPVRPLNPQAHRQQGRRASSGSQVPTSPSTSGATPPRSPMAYRSRGTKPRPTAPRPRQRLVSGGTPGPEARCTKCNLLFPDARSLGEHFIDSPAHPYAAEAPKNSWSPPQAKSKPAASIPRESQRPLPRRQEPPPTQTQKTGGGMDKSVKCDCGMTFKNTSAFAQHRKDSMKHGAHSQNSVSAASTGEDDGASRKEMAGADDDEIDKIIAVLDNFTWL